MRAKTSVFSKLELLNDFLPGPLSNGSSLAQNESLESVWVQISSLVKSVGNFKKKKQRQDHAKIEGVYISPFAGGAPIQSTATDLDIFRHLADSIKCKKKILNHSTDYRFRSTCVQ
jgi:hypothetical protein